MHKRNTIRMNDTPQGDGNQKLTILIRILSFIRMNDTPQGDGNLFYFRIIHHFFLFIRMNDTPQGDGNL